MILDIARPLALLGLGAGVNHAEQTLIKILEKTYSIGEYPNFRQGGFKCYGFCPRCEFFGVAFIEKVWVEGRIVKGKIKGQRIDRKCQMCDWVWLEID